MSIPVFTHQDGDLTIAIVSRVSMITLHFKKKGDSEVIKSPAVTSELLDTLGDRFGLKDKHIAWIDKEMRNIRENPRFSIVADQTAGTIEAIRNDGVLVRYYKSEKITPVLFRGLSETRIVVDPETRQQILEQTKKFEPAIQNWFDSLDAVQQSLEHLRGIARGDLL